jgi:hypothetical protein
MSWQPRHRPRRSYPDAPRIILEDASTCWQRHTIDWYGGKRKTIEIVSGSHLWYTPCFDPLPIRWVLERDPKDKFQPTTFLSTALQADPLQILAWFIMRWSLKSLSMSAGPISVWRPSASGQTLRLLAPHRRFWASFPWSRSWRNS